MGSVSIAVMTDVNSLLLALDLGASICDKDSFARWVESAGLAFFVELAPSAQPSWVNMSMDFGSLFAAARLNHFLDSS